MFTLQTASTSSLSPPKGRLIGPKPPFKLHEIWAIRMHLQLDGQVRDLALLNLAIDSKLRGAISSSCVLVTSLMVAQCSPGLLSFSRRLDVPFGLS